jgi:3-oxoacyl-(acyl-carrier-protein) synthase
MIWTAYRKLRALAAQRGGPEWSSPYDVDRNGLVLGEGAAILVLEAAERARRRGATPYAFIENDISFGVPSSLYDWPTEADAAAAILGEFLATTGADEGFHKEATLRSPLLTKEGVRGRLSVDVVFGSANSSRRLDQFEVDLLSRLFGEGAASVSVTSIAGAIGEFGGAGALTRGCGCSGVARRRRPAVCNLRNRIESALRFAGTTAAARPVKRVLQLSTARGGAMSAILFRGNRE